MYLPILLCILLAGTCYCQIVVPNCEMPLYTARELEENPDFIILISAFILRGEQVAEPVVLDFNFTCLAQGPTQELYRATSVVVDFRADPSSSDMITRRFQLMCFDGAWREPHIDSFEDVRNLNLDPPTRFDCGSCHTRASINNSYHCEGKQ